MRNYAKDNEGTMTTFEDYLTLSKEGESSKLTSPNNGASSKHYVHINNFDIKAKVVNLESLLK